MPELPLRDIHLPEPISWWPLALGWWLMLGFALLLILFGSFFIQRIFRKTLKKEALKALSNLELSFQSSQNTTQCLSQLSALLRRIALSQKSDTQIAGLTGKAWLEFLDKPLGKPEFSEGIGSILLTGPYQSQVDAEKVVQLIQLCRTWVNHL